MRLGSLLCLDRSQLLQWVIHRDGSPGPTSQPMAGAAAQSPIITCAALLLAAIAVSDCGFDAVVVGEYERAFDGDQVLSLLPLFEQHGVQQWLPEAHGPVNSAKRS